VFQAVRSSQIYVNEDTMASSGFSLEQISRFILDYTHERGNPDDAPPLPEAERSEPVFSAAFPITLMGGLDCLPEARG
jgi:hypothetical protein